MELITEYIKPELIVVAVVLYIVGIGLKKTTVVKDKWIPVILGTAGILLCGIWVFANGPVGSGREAALAIFTAIVQGVLAAGASTYVNQILKQLQKEA